jgi:hypothetical protein
MPIELLWSPIEYYFVKEMDYFLLINKSDASNVFNVKVSLPRGPDDISVTSGIIPSEHAHRGMKVI